MTGRGWNTRSWILACGVVRRGASQFPDCLFLRCRLAVLPARLDGQYDEAESHHDGQQAAAAGTSPCLAVPFLYAGDVVHP